MLKEILQQYAGQIISNILSSKDLGYCYDIDDLVCYYKLYTNIMKFWENSLSKKIYNLDYELLTVNQEKETKDLSNT